MTDSKTFVQEVQKELLTAVQRGQEQVRKSQEQLRKSRETVTGVVSGLTKSVGPAVSSVRIPSPARVRAHAQELAGHAVAVQRGLAGKARHAAGPYTERVIAAQRDLAEKARQSVPNGDRLAAVQRDLAERARRAGISEQVAAAQRTLAGRVIEVAKVATPLVAEGRARLTQVVGGRHAGAQPGPTADGIATAADSTAAAADRTTAAADRAAAAAEGTPKLHAVDGTGAAAEESATAPTPSAKARTTKPRAAKAGAAGKTSTTKASTSKPRSTKK